MTELGNEGSGIGVLLDLVALFGTDDAALGVDGCRNLISAHARTCLARHQHSDAECDKDRGRNSLH
jgi:hypothetical protein